MTEEFLRRLDQRRSYIGGYFRKPNVKKNHAEKKKQLMRAQFAKEVADDKLGYLYQAGVVVLGGSNDVMGHDDVMVTAGGGLSVGDGVATGVAASGGAGDAGAGGIATGGGAGDDGAGGVVRAVGGNKPLCKCGATTHEHVTHNDCPLNKRNCEGSGN